MHINIKFFLKRIHVRDIFLDKGSYLRKTVQSSPTATLKITFLLSVFARIDFFLTSTVTLTALLSSSGFSIATAKATNKESTKKLFIVMPSVEQFSEKKGK